MSCDPGPGETVRFRGEFTETIFPTRSGTVIHDVQDIAGVNGFIVTFNQAVIGVDPDTDYLAVYGSRKGNSGAFAVMSASGNQIAVNTSDLPASQFLSETASDPGVLQAAILRPVHFTAWDESVPPIFNTRYQAYHAVNDRVIMVSHLKSIGGNSINPGYYVWPAFKIDGSGGGNSDFHIFDHLEVINADCAIFTESASFQSNYSIIQFCNLHDVGVAGGASNEVIYWGYDGRPDLHHDYAQIMYNKIGPHVAGVGDGIEIKDSAHNVTIFGNEIVGILPNGCADAPLRTSGINTFIANNYLHDINPSGYGCGISIIDDVPGNPDSGGRGAIIVNNILSNVKLVGIRILDSDDVQILNNTIYSILDDPEHREDNMGIMVQNWQGSTENIIIKNNVVQDVYIGIGRYLWSNAYPFSVDNDYNIVFDATHPFYHTITQNANDQVVDPGLVDPENHDFTTTTTSPARDSGTDLASVFNVDNHDAADPRLPAITAPIIRTGVWDRGAYEH